MKASVRVEPIETMQFRLMQPVGYVNGKIAAVGKDWPPEDVWFVTLINCSSGEIRIATREDLP